MTTATIGKWGNASAVRLPQLFCEQVGIGVGDVVEISCSDGESLVIRPVPQRCTLQERMAGWTGGRYASQELDWGEPVGEELW